MSDNKISLVKGESISLYKNAPNLKKIRLGLGWSVSKFASNKNYDLDVSCFCLGKDAKDFILLKANNLVFFNNAVSADGSVRHGGDNRVGSDDDEDAEVIFIELDKVSADVVNLSIVVTIDGAAIKGQNFGMIENAYVKMYNEESGDVIAFYNLTENFKAETAVQFASLYRDDAGSWKFAAIGAGFNADIIQFAEIYRGRHLFS